MYAFIALLVLLNSVHLKGAYLDNRANIFLPFASECICSSGVDPAKAYGYIYDFKYPEDPCFKCFVKCMLTKVGFFASDGEPVRNPALDPTTQITQRAHDICTNETNNIVDLCDKVYKHSKCIASFFPKVSALRSGTTTILMSSDLLSDHSKDLMVAEILAAAIFSTDYLPGPQIILLGLRGSQPPFLCNTLVPIADGIVAQPFTTFSPEVV
ncbi:hypothetical protein FQR65_LT14699 [Abscondita terminalis]|nr:hypothetical protein FQR65_LT14699 [Abscondita terminalis]